MVADNSKMEMTGLVSTSNYMIADQVKVETDAAILWVTASKTHFKDFPATKSLSARRSVHLEL